MKQTAILLPALICVSLANATTAQAQYDFGPQVADGGAHLSVGVVVPFGGAQASEDIRHKPRLELRSGWNAPSESDALSWPIREMEPAQTAAPLSLSLDSALTVYAFDQSVAQLDHGQWTLSAQTGPLCEGTSSLCLSPGAKWAARGALAAGVIVLTLLTMIALGDGSY